MLIWNQSKNISEDTQEMTPRHKRKERTGTNKDTTSATYEINSHKHRITAIEEPPFNSQLENYRGGEVKGEVKPVLFTRNLRLAHDRPDRRQQYLVSETDWRSSHFVGSELYCTD